MAKRVSPKVLAEALRLLEIEERGKPKYVRWKHLPPGYAWYEL